ncbi:hypothetical protein OKW48_006288 [Paraburkholderia youngii]|uniref:Uncharacterized protein n=1 Tax=Paraburkholderia youngii TaxID=2782701 RepID=A0A7W8L0D2_9BURK|nr:hypothetical protein [Paraburkholderia youngii]
MLDDRFRRMVADCIDDSLRDRGSLGELGLREQDEELISSDPADAATGSWGHQVHLLRHPPGVVRPHNADVSEEKKAPRCHA